MPIRFRCINCRSLMAISSRKAGAIVECPTCGEKTLVPHVDVFEGELPARESPDDGKSENADADNSKKSSAATASVEFTVLSEPKEDDADLDSGQGSGREQRPNESHDEPFIPSEVGDEDAEGPLAIRRPRGGDEEMDLTPMVDVTFQLLIFFMVSASFSLQKTIEVPTPDPDQKGATQQVQTLDDLQGTSILVKIDGGNGISIDDEPLTDPSRLSDTLRDKMRREQKTELLITAHAQSQHRLVIAVIDAANEIGVQKIRMSSQKKTD